MLMTGMHIVQYDQYGFAALRSDRQVVTWGDPSFGGYSNSVQKDGLLFPVTRGPRWAKMGQDGPKWAKMGQVLGAMAAVTL